MGAFKMALTFQPSLLIAVSPSNILYYTFAKFLIPQTEVRTVSHSRSITNIRSHLPYLFVDLPLLPHARLLLIRRERSNNQLYKEEPPTTWDTSRLTALATIKVSLQ